MFDNRIVCYFEFIPTVDHPLLGHGVRITAVVDEPGDVALLINLSQPIIDWRLAV